MSKKSKWILWTLTATVIATLVYANLVPIQREVQYQVESENSVKSPHFAKILGELMGPPFVSGNRILTLLNGDQIFPAMLQAIRQAQKTICFESYIYWSGHIGSQFVDALSERARTGVQVHVLLDWVGSQKIDADYIQKMQEAGVQIERYHQPAWYNLTRLNNRTHRKILVVDGTVGFTGGVGIADEWTGDGLDPNRWRDSHFQVEGPVVAQMQAAFLDNWMKVRPEIHQDERYFPELKPAARPGSSAQMFKSSRREGGSGIHVMYLLALAAARHSIFLEGAYFVPDEVTIQEMIKARKRGVRVEIIVPGNLTDSKIVQHASRDSWEELLKAGVKIYEYQKAMFHCKVLVIDEYFVSIGSTNFDERSFKLNDEANLNVLDENFAKEQIRVFEVDKTHSREVRLESWKNRSWDDQIFENIAALFRSQL